MAEISLEIDPVVHDMSLAKDFLKQNNRRFNFILPKEIKENVSNTKFVKDNISNEVLVMTSWPDVPWFDFISKQNKKDSVREVLTKSLENNAKLFEQLEFMIRHISEDETRANLKLIQQYIQTPENVNVNTNNSFVALYDENPLAVLGLSMSFDVPIVILACPNTAAVSTLYVQLCREAGFNVSLLFTEADRLKKYMNERVYGTTALLVRGCTGVVTESADIDTALETLLLSFSKNPWRLHRVLVQENVYDSFKKSLEWKCRNAKQNVPEEIAHMCSVVYQINKKTFLIDYAGNDPDLPGKEGIIFVEAFRTVQELLPLLQSQNPFCVSLWCNDVTTANAIAYSTNAACTWINDYCSFDAPAESSQAFFSHISNDCSEIMRLDFVKKQLENTAWIDVDELREKLENSTGILQELKEMLAIPSYRTRKNVALGSKGLCVAISDISNPVFVENCDSDSSRKHELLKLIATAAQLKRVIIWDIPNQINLIQIRDFLVKLKLPLVDSTARLQPTMFPLYNTRCVWTRFPNKV